MRSVPTLLALSLLAAGASFASAAHAAEGDDRFALRLGAMNIDSDNTLRGNTNVAGQDIGFSEDFKLGGKEWEPRIDGMFRISNRQRLLFNYFKYDKDRRETLGQDISFGNVNVPADSFVKAELKYQVASLVYDYSVVDTEKFDLGLQLGAEYAKVSTKGYADLGTVYEASSWTRRRRCCAGSRCTPELHPVRKVDDHAAGPVPQHALGQLRRLQG